MISPDPRRAVEPRARAVVLLFFAALLLVGWNSFRDFGISWDEEIHRVKTARATLDFVATGDREHLYQGWRAHQGPAFHLFLALTEAALGITDSRQAYFLHHGLTFLTFAGSVWFFYLLARDRFASRWLAVAGCLLLVLCPRIFADSFYNPKDIPFLSLLIVSVYTLTKFAERWSWQRGVVHAITCALLVDVRVVGILVPVMTALAAALGAGEAAPERRVRLSALALHAGMLCLLVVLFWPALWTDPLGNFARALHSMSRFDWEGELLYRGRFIRGVDVPWHYTPVWIAITTPPLTLVLFGVGAGRLAVDFARRPAAFARERPLDVLVLVWLLAPLVVVVALGSVLYDGWRHTFFVYPAVVLVAVHGLRCLDGASRAAAAGRRRAVARGALAAVVAAGLGNTALTMWRMHPHENVYFNGLAGRSMREVKQNFELDYWGLAYRQALEYVVANDSSDPIRIAVANYPGWINAAILPPEERARLHYVRTLEEADYFLGNFRMNPRGYGLPGEVFSVEVGGAEIVAVYRLR